MTYSENTKKATVKDVAREAGVSVATVSYVLNDRKDQKISPEVKKKVLQIANLLNYRPSHAAKSLATGRNNIIGITYYLKDNSPSRNSEILNLSHMLIERMNRLNYDVIFLPLKEGSSDIPSNRNIDAIIAIDLDIDAFKNLAENILVPVIAVDMIVNDDLFYQIYSDYQAAVTAIASDIKEPYYLLLDEYANIEFSKYITKDTPASKVITYPNLTKEKLAQIKDSKCIILGSHLATLVYPYLNPENMHVISGEGKNKWLPESISIHTIDIDKKANLTMNILLNSLNKNFDIPHDQRVY